MGSVSISVSLDSTTVAELDATVEERGDLNGRSEAIEQAVEEWLSTEGVGLGG